MLGPEEQQQPAKESTTTKIPELPNNWDVYPNVMRAYLDGVPLTVPSEAEKAAMHAQVKPAPEQDSTDVHPQLWKNHTDVHSGDAPSHPEGVMTPNDWDMYPEVYKAYVERRVERTPTQEELQENHNDLKSIPADKEGHPDLYPQQWKQSSAWLF